MDKEAFVGYLNEPDLHDAIVRQVSQVEQQLRVLVETPDGALLAFEFSEIQSVKANHPEGMMLYSLSEMKESHPYRKFVFTNWDENDDACLEVIAREIRSDKQ